MERSLLMLGALFGGFGVALGAFGAHALKQVLSPEYLAAFETAVRYQLYHALAILAAAVFSRRHRSFGTAGRLFGLGIVLFSGSLYALTLTGVRPFAYVTPFGGVAFIAGWVLFFVAAFKMQKED